jgi:hypothetical protein
MNETDLIIRTGEKDNLFPPFSARECTQSLTPISQGVLRRTINGVLINLGNKSHRKFHSIISCKDKTPPAFEKLWVGMRLQVGCIQSLTQTISPNLPQIQLEREALSVVLYDQAGKSWPCQVKEKKNVELPAQFPGGFLTYRPCLTMMVKGYQLETDEWGLTVGWRLELEEE